MLSVIIITKNESLHIRQCLESVAWADEIIVFDSGSEDDTVSICREFTKKVYETDWPGFGIQKQRALDKATHNWVLSIDADETVPNQLKETILQAITQPTYTAYKIPRIAIFCGHPIKKGGINHNYTLRLFRRETGRFTPAQVHETIEVKGTIGKLKKAIIHESHIDLEEAITKINIYYGLSADIMLEKGRSTGITKVILKSFWAFFNSYFLQLLFLDGKYGLMYAITNAEESYYKYAKLMLLQNTSNQ